MKILPSETRLPAKPIVRRHRPKQGSYDTYRQCLRWEFGFYCAFCFLHENDLNEHGQGARMTIEHKSLRSTDADSQDVYDNCFYCCDHCNRSRWTRPVIGPDGHRLLDPCETAWTDQFSVIGDLLIPRTEAAAHTADAYRVNAPRKILMRANRKARLNQVRIWIAETHKEISELTREALRQSAPQHRRTLLSKARQLRKAILLGARQELQRFSATPRYAIARCTCASNTHCTLPSFVP